MRNLFNQLIQVGLVNRILKDLNYEKKQDELSKKEIRNVLYGLSGIDFYSYYKDRKNYEEIPLLTNDGIVIPEIGLDAALSKSEHVNIVPTIAGSNIDEVKYWLAFSDYFVNLDYSLGSSLFGLPKIILKDEDAYEAFNYYRSSAWKVRGVDGPLKSLKCWNKRLFSYRFDQDDQRRFFIADFKKLICNSCNGNSTFGR